MIFVSCIKMTLVLVIVVTFKFIVKLYFPSNYINLQNDTARSMAMHGNSMVIPNKLT